MEPLHALRDSRDVQSLCDSLLHPPCSCCRAGLLVHAHLHAVLLELTASVVCSNPVFYSIWALVTTQLGTTDTVFVDNLGREVIICYRV